MERLLEINYRLKTASAEHILLNLIACDGDYNPPLSQRTDLKQYAQKLYEKSLTFEAWNNDRLIGMVAAYFNDLKNRNGYITNICVEENYKGKHIASELIERCIQYGKENNFNNLYLEVNKDSSAAINLYKKYHFTFLTLNCDFWEMRLNLTSST